MPGAVSWMTILRRYWHEPERSRFGDAWMVQRARWRYWVVNVVLFVCLTVPALLVGTAGWPLRVAAAAGLIGACVWEGVAVRLGRFSVWADVLETVAVVLVAWRYPSGTGGLVFILAFALPALGFRLFYSNSVQAVARTLTVLAAIYVGSTQNPAPVGRRLPLAALAVVLVAFLSREVARLVGLRASMTHRRRVADQLTDDLATAKGRKDVHAAILRAVLELMHGRTDARVIIWDEPGNWRPTAAAGANADEVHTAGGNPLSAVPWVREAIDAGESTYRTSFDDVEELRSALGFDPIPGVVFVVPLRHREQIRALSVSARQPIPPEVRKDIEYVAKVGEVALGSIELTREGLEGLRERNYFDPGTGLANRDLLRRRIGEALQQQDRLVAVLVIRIGRFRTIDDSLGNIAGGDALITLIGRLEGAAPHGTVARFGSDEFAVLLDRLAEPAEAEQVAARIVAALDEPLPGLLGSGAGVFLHGSIGVAVSGPDVRTATDLLRNADVAVEAAGGPEAGTYRVFDPAMRASMVDRFELESDLSRALHNDEFELHYQPIVQLQAWERISGVEALIRWNRGGRGMVSPAQFIPAAEETGLINQIGAWVLRESCRQQRDWATIEPELAGLTVSVNLSPVQLARADVTRMIGEAVGETGADPAQMVIELTESALVENSAANLDKLQAIKAVGVRLALDDFGTGFSSLGYLRQFPFDVIKIDRSFVQEVDVDEGAAALASSVIRIGKALNLTSLAEGVETIGQADWLTKAGCDAAQGYFFAPPMPPDQLRPMLSHGLSLPSTRS